MTQPLHIIYITGLGDEKYPKDQIRAVSRWVKYGVEAEVFRMKWGDKGPWEPKLKGLLDRIDELTKAGKSVGLVGVSAGGAAALSAFSSRKNNIVGVVILCGKIRRVNTIGPRYYTKNPALVDAVKASEAAISGFSEADLAKILSRYSLLDGTLSRKDSNLPGATNRRFLIPSHFLSIAYQITIGSKRIIRFLQKLNH